MKLKELTREELEQLTYTELAERVLTEKGTKLKIVDIFKKICDLLELPESAFENQVADFFELISTDKNFIVLDKGYCDLRKKHAPKAVVVDEEDESIDVEVDMEESDEDIIESETENEEDIFYDSSSEDDDVTDDDDELDDFIMVDEEEESNL